jgi:predicted P-loop ATPase
MLVLIGGQGKRKTSVLEKLTPKPEWFQPDLPDIRQKDSMQALTGVMIVNADEMNAFKRADVVELAKNFLTRSADRYRPPYGAIFKTVPRRCVFAGTSNNKEVLNDPTGSRRFWCVEVGRIDLEALARDRDQLWAEAVSMYMDGSQWWPDRTGESMVSERNRDQFTMVDPWAETIESLCGERDCVTMKEIFAELNFDSESKHGTAETRRITSILIGMGWEQRGQKQIGKRRERTWKKKQ